MQLPTFKHISQLVSNYDLFLFDIWGVIIEGEKLYPGVIPAINEVIKQKKVLFVSNAPRPAFIMKDRLKKWGLNVTEEMIITSGDIARRFIFEETRKLKLAKPTIYHLGDDNNNDILIGIDHILTDDYNKADFFLLSLHRNEDQNIREFDILLKEVAVKPDLLKICANPDIIAPTGGIVRYCAGYFAEIILQHGGKVVYTGKPKAIMYDTVLAKAGKIKKDRILMIGDSFETDILGAQKAGIDSALVMTGNAYKIHASYKTFEEKLVAIRNKAMEFGISPTFITEIS